MVQKCVKVYRHLDLFCHSVAMAMPPITPLPNHLSLPLLVRMVTRGACDRLDIFKIFALNSLFSTQSDVSSFELFAFSSVNVDPLKVRQTNLSTFDCYLNRSQLPILFPDHVHLEDYAGQDSAKSGVKPQ